MQITFVPNDKGSPVGKLADAELHFTDGPLEGLKLTGFAVWEATGSTQRFITFPARTYALHPKRLSVALLQPIADSQSQDRLRDRVLKAYTAFETERANR